MDQQLFDQLLAEGESSHLDYKRDQYPLSDVGEKAKLIKDVLAMANSSRQLTAYILIGVHHQRGQRASVTGIRTHLDDADLQQLVNGKTNRPITFSYTEFEFAEFTVGVIEIPVQRRPFFLKKQFGNLRAGTVYLRRGSSTDVADPDEIHRMGAESVADARIPTIEVQFADINARTLLGRELQITQLVLVPLSDDALPRLAEYPAGYNDPFLNRDYYHELRDYVWTHNAVFNVGFAAQNKSATVALGVRAEFSFEASQEIMLAEELPPHPKKHRHIPFSPPSVGNFGSDVSYRKHGNTYFLDVEFGKIQPRSDTWTGTELFIGTAQPKDLTLAGRVYGDNFEPVPLELHIRSKPTIRMMTTEDLEQKAKRARERD